MSKRQLALFAGAALLWLAPSVALAQYPRAGFPRYNPSRRPQLSPYLNLLRGGDPAANYFLGTLPERQRRINTEVFGSAILNLAQQQQRPSMRPDEERDLFTPLPTTGHPVAFQNYGSYYDFGAGRSLSPQQGFQPVPRRR